MKSKTKTFTFHVTVEDIPYNKDTIGINEDAYVLQVLGEFIQSAKVSSLIELSNFRNLHREKIANGSLSPTELAKVRHLRERSEIYQTIEVTGRA